VPSRTSESAWKTPAGAWDTHVHVFDPSLGPYSPDRAYTPMTASLEDLLSFSSSLSIHGSLPANLVLVQPSPYGTDNTLILKLLEASQKSGLPILWRGIAVVDISTVKDEDLALMDRLGVRGLRINVEASGHGIQVDELKKIIVESAERIKSLGRWKLQLFLPGEIWDGMFDDI
jgi:predicted TIM-barrel fold metal-dependent hydrolase